MTVPMIWGILAVVGKTVVDTFFVARLGTDPLTAISFTFPVVLTVTSVAIGLGAGAASVVSRTIGEGDAQQVRRRATDTLVLSAVLMAAAAATGLMTLRPLFQAFADNRPLTYLASVFVLILGLLLVVAHNVWVAGWPVIVTLLSWLVLIKAVAYLLLPQEAVARAVTAFDRPAWFILGGAVTAGLGLFLAGKGFQVL